MLIDTNRNVRREGIRASGENSDNGLIRHAFELRNDTDPEVRAEVIRACGRTLSGQPRRVLPHYRIDLVGRFLKSTP